MTIANRNIRIAAISAGLCFGQIANASLTMVVPLAGAQPGELAAGRLPSNEFAPEWLTFVQRQEPLSIWKP